MSALTGLLAALGAFTIYYLGAWWQGAGTGLAALILGPIFVIIYLAVIRMTLEFYLSVVRMSEDIHKRLPQA